MKKYLLVIRYCEEEAYFYNSLDEMLQDWQVLSIDELLNMSNGFIDYSVYEVNKVWSKKNE